MKKAVLIPDSFKGTMSSQEIIDIMSERILAYYPDCQIVSVPVADGGEGSVDAFLSAVGGERISIETQGPYGEKMMSFYGMLPDGTAVVEMAASAGLPLVGENRNPSTTTTYGVGELISDAARRGAKKIVIGLGGSATNDAGCGAAAACGVSFYDAEGNRFIPKGESLDRIARIDTSTMIPELKAIPIVAMCDIDNPFYGPAGAPAVFGPQKGADEEMVKVLDGKMRKLADVIKKDIGVSVQDIPGSGAAGGMGGGMLAFLSAQLQMGIDTVLEVTGFDKLAEGADFIFTGEGKIDTQSLRGKVVIGVARRAKAIGVPVIAIVGDIGDDIEKAYELGVTGIFSTNRVAVPFSQAKPRAKSDMKLTVDNLVRFMRAVQE